MLVFVQQLLNSVMRCDFIASQLLNSSWTAWHQSWCMHHDSFAWHNLFIAAWYDQHRTTSSRITSTTQLHRAAFEQHDTTVSQGITLYNSMHHTNKHKHNDSASSQGITHRIVMWFHYFASHSCIRDGCITKRCDCITQHINDVICDTAKLHHVSLAQGFFITAQHLCKASHRYNFFLNTSTSHCCTPTQHQHITLAQNNFIAMHNTSTTISWCMIHASHQQHDTIEAQHFFIA